MELLRISLVNQYKMIAAVQACIKVIAYQHNMSEKDIDGLNLAVEEAMANVIKYGFDQASQHYFDLAIEVNGIEFTVVISDKGIPGNFSQDNHEDKLGICIMQHFVDSLTIKNLGYEGREQRLIKYLSAVPEYTTRFQEERINLPEDAKFEYRPLRQEEAIEVARCIYDEFEFNYIYEYVYYPERFFAACQSGQVYSLVAVAPNGEIAGHLAAMRLDDFPGIMEMGIGVVKKKYRRYSIMKHLTDKIVQYCQNASGINAFLGEPVAYHTITQKMCEKFGLIPCGFAFQYCNLKILDNKRASLCLAMKIFSGCKEHTIYVPDLLAKLIRQIYDSIGIKVKIAQASGIAKNKKSAITLKEDRHNKFAKLFIHEVGEDISLQIKLALQTVKRDRSQAVLLYINMFDSAMEFGFNEAVKHGFFFVGCFPMSNEGDYLCMELMINQAVDYEMLVLTPAFSAMLNEIRLQQG